MDTNSQQQQAATPALSEGSGGGDRIEEADLRTAASFALLRSAQEVRKPKDWQDFQRRCVVLFADELNDPHCREYGRPGQAQGGIDILGQRGAATVGIQCRLVAKPLKVSKIRQDCRAALALPLGIREIIFATTAPEDVAATNAAHAVEQELRAEGHDVRVVLYGWEALTQIIARHPRAYAHFNPETGVTTRERDPTVETDSLHQKLDLLTSMVAAQGRATQLPSAADAPHGGEDPALHARIDAYRDLGNEGQSALALEKLSAIQAEVDAAALPNAAFRLLTIRASNLFELGRENEACALWERAHTLQPNNPRALSNLGMARLVQERFDEAFSLASSALTADPALEQALAVLLQAAARSGWEGEPRSLIPDALVDSSHAASGLIEFLRWREDPSWEEEAHKAAARHKDAYFRHMAAHAVLVRAVSSGGEYLRGGEGSVTKEELEAAATELKAIYDQRRAAGYSNLQELATLANNTALALRLLGRFGEAIDVLETAIAKVGERTDLLRLLGIVQAVNGDVPAAMATLARAPDDSEAQLARAEMQALTDRRAALEQLLAMDPARMDAEHAAVRFVLIAEFALALGEERPFNTAVEELAGDEDFDLMARMLRVEWDARTGAVDPEEAATQLEAIAADIPATAPLHIRLTIAERLQKHGRPLTASRALEGHVNLQRPTDAAKLYLEVLAAGRRDQAFLDALADASPELRSDPDVIWINAAHAWNCDDLPRAEVASTLLLQNTPDDLRARLLHLDLLARQDRVEELEVALDQPLEDLSSRRLSDRFRVVKLLQHFGRLERAAKLAYRLFLEHRDQARAWMTLAGVVLARGDSPEAHALFRAQRAGPDVAIVAFDDGAERFFVIEPDARLRRVDAESVEPDHELAAAVLGLSEGERFSVAGRHGAVKTLRSKYVARFHTILRDYETRFPTIFGLKSIQLNPGVEGGLDEVLATLKDNHEHVLEEARRYDDGSAGPLAILAYRTGVNVIDAAAGVAALGFKLKVAGGSHQEREACAAALERHGRAGCVLDTLTYWNAHQLGLLNAVEAVCGRVHLARRTLDALRARREHYETFTGETGFSSMSYQDGRVALREVGTADVRHCIEEVQQAIEWAEAHAETAPISATDDLPEALLSFLAERRADIFDEVVVAIQRRLLFVSDDRPLREIAFALGVSGTAWLQQVAATATDQGDLDPIAYADALGALLEAGQSYLGVSAASLVAALDKDVQAGLRAPGNTIRSLARAVGGPLMDVRSHVGVVLAFLREIWRDTRFATLREPATGLILRELVKSREDDHRAIQNSIRSAMKPNGQLRAYFEGWLRGHFVNLSA